MATAIPDNGNLPELLRRPAKLTAVIADLVDNDDPLIGHGVPHPTDRQQHRRDDDVSIRQASADGVWATTTVVTDRRKLQC